MPKIKIVTKCFDCISKYPINYENITRLLYIKCKRLSDRSKSHMNIKKQRITTPSCMNYIS